jgi:hypothetical protein
VAKHKNIRLDNLIYLTGLRPDVAARFAEVIEKAVDELTNRVDDRDVKSWRRRATHSNHACGTRNYSFRGFQLHRLRRPSSGIRRRMRPDDACRVAA